MTRLPLLIVAAVARNGIIGADNRLLWRLSSDLKHFKALTLGKPLVMGRKTFQSIGRLLPGRETIVVTRYPGFKAEGVLVAHGLDAALALAEARAEAMGADAIVIAGGASSTPRRSAAPTASPSRRLRCRPQATRPFPASTLRCGAGPARRGRPRPEGRRSGFGFVEYKRAAV